MIRFILFLPIRIVGLLFVKIGAVLDGVNRRRIEKEKQLEKQRREYERIARIESARIEKEKRERARLDRQAQADRRRAEKEKQAQADRLERKRKQEEKEQAARIATEQKKQREKEQAEKDIERYKDLLKQSIKLYGMLHNEYEQATENKNSKKAIVTYRQMIAADKASREIERKIEQAKQILHAG
jgi:hypothetical protein